MSIDASIKFFIVQAAEAAAEKVRSELAKDITHAINQVLDQREEKFQPLNKILGKTAGAAREHLRRHPDLAALGVPVGNRLHFKRADVDAYFAAKKAARGGAR